MPKGKLVSKAKKKSVITKKVVKTSSKKAAAFKWPSITSAMSKSTMLKLLADASSLSKKEVVNVLDNLAILLEKHLKGSGPGEFVLPGIMKIRVVKKPATKARDGINPFTGEKIRIQAKPAHKKVKIKALKKLKEMVA